MTRKHAPSKPNDQRWTLIDSVLRRLIFLVAHFGVSPQEFLDRVKRIMAEKRTEEATRKIVDSRTYSEAHAGAAIMRSWHRELAFLDPAGQPKPLSQTGENSFEDLVAITSPTVRPDVALADLLAAGAVEEARDGSLIARSFRVTQSDQQRRAEIALYAIDNLLTSVGQNVRMEPSLRTLQSEAVCFHFDRKQLPRLKRQLTEQCVAHMEQTDDWLNRHELPAKSRGRDAATVIVGLYITVRDDQKIAAKKKQRTRE